jgi:hypothetical protein
MLTTRIRREGEHVLVQFDDGGKSFVIQLEGRVAVELGAQLRQQGLLADEWAQAERIAADSAVLLRAGANFGLSSDPRILDEARKEAAWNSDLRRYMPGGVRSEECFGTPTVRAHQPTKTRQ